ncbi:MAG: DUF2780 domain-containing protein [Pseudomonadota bacterium]
MHGQTRESHESDSVKPNQRHEVSAVEDLINNIVARLGIEPEVAEKVVGIIMNLFKENASAESFGALTDSIPGAQDLMSRFDAGELGGTGDAAGNAGGGLLGAAMGMLGGGNPLMDTLSKLQAEGISMDQAKGAGS